MQELNRAAVLGRPIAHSLSPLLHRVAYAELGLSDWEYASFDTGEDDLAGFVADLDETWRGLSLTMPLKEAALLVAAESSQLSRQTGVVNTLVRHGDDWHGDNTDVHGITQALIAAGVGSRGAVEHAVVVGSGATARSALASLAELGATHVDFLVRSTARASTLAQARDHGMSAAAHPVDDASLILDAQVVISTVPVGASDPLALQWQRQEVDGSGVVVLDAVYADWPTSLATVAAEHHATVVSGLEMLVHQAARQVELMTGQRAPLQAMLTAGRAALVS